MYSFLRQQLRRICIKFTQYKSQHMQRIIFLLFCAVSVSAQPTFYGNEPFAHTYSIVAIDPETGDMGVAVQSHWFAVGTAVAWGEAGVGVVATQSFVNVSFGVRGLALLKAGLTPQQVVDSLLATDEARELRQLAVLDKSGRVATHTGKKCIQPAGHLQGQGYSAQANMMQNDKVWGAMAKAFENAKGPLAERLLTALFAAEETGGDFRGKQSAALYVYRARSTGNVWEEKKVDLRVDDHAEPLKELSRLLKVHRAYEHMNAGDLAVEKNDMKKALEEYGAAQNLFPENEEMQFWTALALLNNGNSAEAYPLLRAVFRKNNNWQKFLPNLFDAGLINIPKEKLKELQTLK
jgi:uncharacterized Ntn-hydrolase superfamily protein